MAKKMDAMKREGISKYTKLVSDLPTVTPLELPPLQGVSERQIKYGEDMRNKMLANTFSDIFYTDKRELKTKSDYKNIGKSPEQIVKEDIDYHKSIGTWRPENYEKSGIKFIRKKITKTTERYSEMKKHVSQFPTSAKFWIDYGNSDNYDENNFKVRYDVSIGRKTDFSKFKI